MEKSKDNVISYYDQFADQQEETGINSRHLQILDKLVDSGLKKHHKILEVGCGIGTVSHLLASYVNKGNVLAVDISPESIKKAKGLWGKQRNLEFMVSDMSDFTRDEKFDFFVFPDVLEHIPVDQHPPLFKTVRNHAHEDSVIFVHIPAPRFLEWMIRNEPEKLQVIDQPLDSGDLIKSISTAGFYLEKMKTYSIFYSEKDYQYFVFRSAKDLNETHSMNKWQVLKERIRIRLRHKIFN